MFNKEYITIKISDINTIIKTVPVCEMKSLRDKLFDLANQLKTTFVIDPSWECLIVNNTNEGMEIIGSIIGAFEALFLLHFNVIFSEIFYEITLKCGTVEILSQEQFWNSNRKLYNSSSAFAIEHFHGGDDSKMYKIITIKTKKDIS